MKTKIAELSQIQIDRIIEMGWEDRTPFEAIEAQFGINEKQVIIIMRRNLHPRNWRKWRSHVQGRATKHLKKRNFHEGRHRSQMHRTITLNRISKKNK
jgi:uncharacterized protein (TIGR03643 family)